MIDQLGRRAAGREITLRINPGFGHGHSRKTNTGGEQSKHGIWHEQIGRVPGRGRPHGLAVTGLHMHIGSGTDLEHLSQVCAAHGEGGRGGGPHASRRSAPAAACRRPYRAGDAYVDLAAYFALWDATRAAAGKTASATAAAWKSSPADTWWPRAATWWPRFARSSGRATTLFYLLDAGFNNLARPILYGAYHPMSIVPADGGAAAAEQRGDRGRPAVRVGRHLHAGRRRLRRHPPLPEADVGDLLVIECAGAYGFVMGSNYNSRPLAAEVLIHDGQPRSDPPPPDLRGHGAGGKGRRVRVKAEGGKGEESEIQIRRPFPLPQHGTRAARRHFISSYAAAAEPTREQRPVLELVA